MGFTEEYKFCTFCKRLARWRLSGPTITESENRPLVGCQRRKCYRKMEAFVNGGAEKFSRVPVQASQLRIK